MVDRITPGGIPAGVRKVKAKPDDPDAIATQVLLEAYSDKDGFHCPWCKVTITDGEEAVQHLADEINRVFRDLAKGV